MNIVDLITSQLGGEVLGKLGGLIGASESQTRSATNAAVPAILGSLANAFIFKSGTMDYVITIIGVVVFTGLTAYHVQRLKTMGESVINGTESAQKMALMGALSLYLAFINLFLMLLRLFGGRRD